MATMPDEVKTMLRERAAASKRPKLRTMAETDAGAAIDYYLDTFGEDGRLKSINLLGRFGVRLHLRSHYIGGLNDRSRVVFPDSRKSVVYPDEFVDLVVRRDMMPPEMRLTRRDFAPMDGHGLLASWLGYSGRCRERRTTRWRGWCERPGRMRSPRPGCGRSGRRTCPRRRGGFIRSGGPTSSISSWLALPLNGSRHGFCLKTR